MEGSSAEGQVARTPAEWYHDAGFNSPFDRLPSESLRSQLTAPVPGGKRKAGGGAKGAGALSTGSYCLDEPPACDAYIQYVSGALKVTEEMFEQLWAFGSDPEKVPPTRNPMNKNTFIKRKQATFGTTYRFGGQTSVAIGGPEASWPVAVQMALADARSRSSRPDTLTAVHTNWYPDGSAGLQPHTDKEDLFIPDMPIYSYTLLSDPSLPRGFQIYRIPEGKEPLYDIRLGHGDLLVMAGDMQKRYMHGVKATASQAYEGLRRINMTVRSVDPSKVAPGPGAPDAGPSR